MTIIVAKHNVYLFLHGGSVVTGSSVVVVVGVSVGVVGMSVVVDSAITSVVVANSGKSVVVVEVAISPVVVLVVIGELVVVKKTSRGVVVSVVVVSSTAAVVVVSSGKLSSSNKLRTATEELVARPTPSGLPASSSSWRTTVSATSVSNSSSFTMETSKQRRRCVLLKNRI